MEQRGSKLTIRRDTKSPWFHCQEWMSMPLILIATLETATKSFVLELAEGYVKALEKSVMRRPIIEKST
jgi:hypothetical protein